MQPISAPIQVTDQGPHVANLQDALRFFVERGKLDIPDPARGRILEALARERARELYGDGGTQLLVKGFQAQYHLPVTGEVDDATAAALNKLLKELGAFEEPEQPVFIVRGQVRYADGTPAPGQPVRAFDKDLRTEEPLGDPATTAKDGRYEIRYTAQQFRRAEKGNADLIVRVADGTTTPPPESPIRFNAQPEETIDLTLPIGTRGPSEYERYLRELEPVLEGVPLTNLQDNDIDFLAGDTGIERQHISWLAESARRNQDTDAIPPQVYYALFRQGMPTKLSELLLQPADLIREALERSLAANVIPAHFRDDIAGYLQTFEKRYIAREQRPSSDPLAPTLRDPLHPTLKDRFDDLYDDDQLQTLAQTNAKHSLFSAGWQQSLGEEGFLPQTIASIQATYLLGGLTENNLSLAKALGKQYRIASPVDLRKLAALNRAEWASLAANHGVPAERLAGYTKNVAHTIESAFAGAVMAREMERGTLAVSDEARPLLKKFFANNPDYEFDTHSVTPFLAEGGGANLTGIEHGQVPRLQEELLRLDRVSKLVPHSPDFELPETVNALLSAGFDSAHRVVSLSQRDFVARIKNSFSGGEQAATQAYGQAEHNASLAMVLASEYLAISASPVAAVTATETTPQAVTAIQTPDLATLFGNLDFCACAECRSVHSPAAYLVDLLKFIRDRQTTASKIKDALFNRRPDLGEIELTCENTNTPVPYVDLVNEILEDAVAPLPPFTPQFLNVVSIPHLDNRDIKELKKANPDTFVANLSVNAEVEVKKRGEWWSIDEPAFTYAIRTENSMPKVVARSRQTKGAAAERAAQPQYINHEAYKELRTQVFPWSLPFDFPLEQTTAYLRHLDVRRWQILEAFPSGERRETLNSFEYACAYLELSTSEAKIITGTTTRQPGAATPGAWNFWGFADAQSAIPDPTNNTGTISNSSSDGWLKVVGGRVDVFLQQSNLTYRELLDLLDTYFVNPLVGAVRKVSVVSTDPKNPETCETDKLKLEGLDEGTAIRVVRFVRLWRKLGWRMRDVDRAIMAFAPPLGSHPASPEDIIANQAFLVQLAHVGRLKQELNVPVARLLSGWANLDTAQYRDFTDSYPVLVPSVYAQMFHNRAALDPLDQDFVEDAAKLAGKVSAHYGSLATALGLSPQDVAILATDVNVLSDGATLPALDDTLNLKNLSRLYRHTTLAKALRLSIRDYVVALQIIDVQPFASTIDTVMFVERMQLLRDVGFSIAELDDLLRPQPASSASMKIAEDNAAIVLDDLRRSLRQLIAEYDALDPTTDLQGDLTRQKLALLNWDTALVERIIGTLNGAVTYQATLDPLPAGFNLPHVTGHGAVDLDMAVPTIPQELNVTYDSTNKKLRAGRFLTATEREKLRALSVDVQYTAAVDALGQLQDELQRGLTYGTILQGEQQKGELSFRGAMTLGCKTFLEGLSLPPGYNRQSYQQAVRSLSDAPRTYVRRAMRRYSMKNYAVALQTLPQNLAFPQSLEAKSITTPQRRSCISPA
jgi:hypothetical protein